MFDMQKGYSAVQALMGGYEAPAGFKPEFHSNWLVRAWRRAHFRKRGFAIEHIAGCKHCGEKQCVEEGPCGGAMCMVHCHACGRDYYGGSHGISKDSPYAKKDSHYYHNRHADRTYPEVYVTAQSE